MIPGVLGRSLNSNITYKLLCGRPVFPDYLSVSYDYDLNNKYLKSYEAITKKIMFFFQNIYVKYALITIEVFLKKSLTQFFKSTSSD